jgi:prepilin-type N-terminal cleavage/methylation domain-containing protein
MLRGYAARGFTLIEVTVALGILLAGIVGSSVMLLQSVRHERETATRRTAIRLAGSLAEELRALQPPAGVSLPADAPALLAWRAAAVAVLPDGAEAWVEPAGTAPPMYRIAIAWPVAGLGLQRLTLAVTP